MASHRKQLKGFVPLAAVVVAVASAAMSARAATTLALQLDVNSITVQAFDAAGQQRWGGATHTGKLVLGADADALLDDIRIDDVSRPFTGHLTGLSGEIRLSAGSITGGELTVTAAGADLVPQTYTLTIAPTAGPDVMPGSPFALAELTAGGRFSAPTFASTNVAPFYAAAAPLDGAFLLTNFAPDARGFSAVANLELFAETTAVPEPAGAALVGLVVASFVCRRRRRPDAA